MNWLFSLKSLMDKCIISVRLLKKKEVTYFSLLFLWIFSILGDQVGNHCSFNWCGIVEKTEISWCRIARKNSYSLYSPQYQQVHIHEVNLQNRQVSAAFLCRKTITETPYSNLKILTFTFFIIYWNSILLTCYNYKRIHLKYFPEKN